MLLPLFPTPERASDFSISQSNQGAGRNFYAIVPRYHISQTNVFVNSANQNRSKTTRAQTKPDQTNPTQTRPDQTNPTQPKPDQTRPDQPKPNQTKRTPSKDWHRMVERGGSLSWGMYGKEGRKEGREEGWDKAD